MNNKLLILLALHLGLVAALAQPIITNQPQNQTAIAGTTAMFTVGAATGTPPLSYQWRSHANATTFTNIPFGTEATLVLTNVQPTSRRFAVVVTDAGGLSATSSPFVTLTVFFPPTIVAEPTDQNIVAAESASFSVVAAGTAPLSYQWYFNSQLRSGATASNLVIASVQLSNAGAYQVVITNLYGSVTSCVAELAVVPPTTFTKITNGTIVTELGAAASCAWGDYDGDGVIDLIVPGARNGLHPGGSRTLLFRNNGGGSFSKITNTTLTVEARDWRSCSWADYDNDGNLDLFLTSVDANGVAAENELFRNNGDGSFTKMTADAVGPIVSLAPGNSEGAIWADYDRDGFLDLFVARYAWQGTDGQQWLFHNSGDGTFIKVTNQMVGLVADDKRSYGPMWGDYDNDGWPDLFVPVINSPDQRNILYRNLGGGAFTRIASGTISTDNEDSGTGSWGDYDNDGYLDLIVANGGLNRVASRNSLYRNSGDGTFTKMSRAEVGSLADELGPWWTSAIWGDYDNDGFLDLFVTQVSGGVNYLYRNNGNGAFTRIQRSSLVADSGVAFTGAWGDYDNDGFLDLFVGRGGDIDDATNQLFHNDGNSNGWIKVKLIGTVSNRSAVGAKVRIQATIFGRRQWQLREISSGNGICGNPLVAHFGLGNATNTETLRIEWPSGTVQEFHDIAPRMSLTMVEPAHLSAGTTGGQPQVTLKGGRNLTYDIQTSTNLPDWSANSSVTITNFNGTVPIPVPMPQDGPQKFYRAVLR